MESGAIVAAGAIVTPGSVVKAGEIWAGNPARKLRDLLPEEAAFIEKSASNYAELAQQHKCECHGPWAMGHGAALPCAGASRACS